MAHYYAGTGVDVSADAAMVPEMDLCRSECCLLAHEHDVGLRFVLVEIAS